jgi:hypothetical protein
MTFRRSPLFHRLWFEHTASVIAVREFEHRADELDFRETLGSGTGV